MPSRARRSRSLALTVVLSLVGSLSARSDAQDTPPAPPEPPQQVPPQEPPKAPETPPQEPPKAPGEAPPAGPDGAKPVPAAPAAGETPEKAQAAPAADLPTDAEDAAARVLLTQAAERQGGKSLAAPDGSLDSFRIVFHKVTLHRETTNADGSASRKRMDSEEDGLKVWWKSDQVRTEWRLMGETPVVRGVMTRKKADGTAADLPWLFDGSRATMLLGEQYEKDRAEIERDRRIVRALLQAAVLRTMLADGSRWKLVDDATFAGKALRRTPPAGSDQPLRLTLWVDPKSSDVTAAKLSPNEPGESTMTYALEYHPEFPKVKDGVLRFPFHFRVQEQRIPEQKPMDVMEGWAKEASFNDVDDAEFKPPKPSR